MPNFSGPCWTATMGHLIYAGGTSLAVVDEHTENGAGDVQLEVADLDHLGVVSQVWDELDFTAVIDQAVPADDQVAVSPGIFCKAMTLNIVSGRDPLYRVEEFFRRVPIEPLLGEGVTASQFNDTALQRHLDRLHAADGEKVFSTLAMRAIGHEKLSLDRLHADTTSRLVFGEYRHGERDDVISITYGHSKDHRPDLKQVMMGIATTCDGVPVLGQMLDGNQSDKAWHKQLVGVIRDRLSIHRSKPLHYVGDSALITEANLRTACEHGIVVTGRLPRTVGACDEFVAQALGRPDAWQDIGTFSEVKDAASYSAQWFRGNVLGQDVQLGVYQTTANNKRAQKSVLRRQDKSLTLARKRAAKLGEQVFACVPDAQQDIARFIKSLHGQLLQASGKVEVRQVPAPAPRGRPKKGAVRAMVEQIVANVTVEVDVEAAQAAIHEESCFVLLHTGETDITTREMLRIYKGQSVVETRFPFLKAPEWADVFFIKTPRRVEALGYLLMIALLVWSLWERRVRLNLQRSAEKPIRDTTGFKKKSPTAAVNCHILKGLKLVRLWQNGVCSPWQLATRLNAEQQRLLRFSAALPLPATRTSCAINQVADGGGWVI